MKKYHQLNSILVALGALSSNASAVVYLNGQAPSVASSGLTFGTHLIGGTHTSVAGQGGGGLSSDGSNLNGQRTYIYDQGPNPALDLVDGEAKRADPGFAMMIWDMGAAFDSLRLYTHQDHYSGGPINDGFTAQDVMEYSVWGSSDGDNFVLLSDVTAFNLTGDGPGLPTYTFNGTAPSVVYRGGSAEYGTVNAYTREYVFGNSYQYYGIRTSTVSLLANDADPEIDSIAAFNINTRPPGTPGTPTSGVPDGGSTALLMGAALSGLFAARRKASGRTRTATT